MKAIETRYKGYRFRSRLEARWAVYFDALGLKWEYEPQGYELDGVRYLPDFVVECMGFVEIKPQHERASVLEKYRETWTNLAEHSGRNVYVLFGSPWDAEASGPAGGTTGGGVWFSEYGEHAFVLCECRRCGGLSVATPDGPYALLACADGCDSERFPSVGEHIVHAIRAARGSRFEHGETPAPVAMPARTPRPPSPLALEAREISTKMATLVGQMADAPPDRRPELERERSQLSERLQEIKKRLWVPLR